ncbi:hypothetical protein RIF29_14804 [Crotalaria pallida]|uniref:Uncharacterized protein n=1 Tax=Crotalaria pallida TaxID=3830 RepID=A0AAN9FEG1_CROPI
MELNLVQTEETGVIIPTKSNAVKSGDERNMEPKEAGGNQTQLVDSGSKLKTNMKSGDNKSKANAENNHGVWIERNNRIFKRAGRSTAVVLYALRKEMALRISFCFPHFWNWKDRAFVDRIRSEL